MKCIQCGTDNKLRDRTVNQGRCKTCNHQFAFEPNSMRKLQFTDPAFAKAITDISANNTLFFTRKQFFYFWDRRLKNRFLKFGFSWLFVYILIAIFTANFFGTFIIPFLGKATSTIGAFLVSIIFIYSFFANSNSSKTNYRSRRLSARNLKILGVIILSVGGFFSLVVIDSFTIFVSSVILGMLSIYLGIRQQIRQTGISETFLVDQNQFQDWINRWTRVNNSIAKMLPPPRQETIPAAVSPDISAYSFDRVVVCDDTEIAQLLIANNFHFENNCAILSITGYPQNIFDTVMQMLRRNSDLKVYALHNASPRGVRLVHHLRTSPNWFQNSNVTIYDLGLLPRQILNSPNVFVQATDESAQQAKQLPSDVRQELTKEELDWLEAGKFVELESFTPQKLLQVVTQGIAKSRTPDISDSLVPIDGGSGDVFIFASDSFG